MKLNRATRYALYALLELAGDPEKHLSATEIAQKYGISVNHLVKVLHDLSGPGWSVPSGVLAEGTVSSVIREEQPSMMWSPSLKTSGMTRGRFLNPEPILKLVRPWDWF